MRKELKLAKPASTRGDSPTVSMKLLCSKSRLCAHVNAIEQLKIYGLCCCMRDQNNQ